MLPVIDTKNAHGKRVKKKPTLLIIIVDVWNKIRHKPDPPKRLVRMGQ